MLGGEGLHVSGHCVLHSESDARAVQRFPVPTTTTLPIQSCHPVAILAFLSGISVGHRVNTMPLWDEKVLALTGIGCVG